MNQRVKIGYVTHKESWPTDGETLFYESSNYCTALQVPGAQLSVFHSPGNSSGVWIWVFHNAQVLVKMSTNTQLFTTIVHRISYSTVCFK